MNCIAIISAVIASLALCAADVSHLGLSRTYLPPSTSYSTYPSYSGSAYSSGGGYYSGSGAGLGYNSGSGLGYNTGYNSGYSSVYPGSGGYNSGYSTSTGSGYSSGYPLVASGYTVPQYTNYATPSRTYLPAVTTGYSSGLDTKYGSNGGYIY